MTRPFEKVTVAFLPFIMFGYKAIAQDSDMPIAETSGEYFIQPWLWSAIGIVVLIILFFSLKRKSRLEK